MKPRFCLVVPTYNNPNSIEEVVQDCLKLTSLPIIVIDDGSEPPMAITLHERVSIFRQRKNLGKGAALQLAFQLAIEAGYTHAVTIDGDGQHLVEEVPKLIDKATQNPWSLVIGDRALHGEHVPEISRFGRRFSNFWVKFETSKPVQDSQSGFRVYPLFHVQNIKFWTKRFDFEIEVLIRLMWRGVEVCEVPIDVHYPPASERVSHFDKLWDNVRISLLNAALVTISLLRVPESPFKISLAVAFGVAIGTYPVFGFHSLIAAGFALAFRLNFIALVLGTQISMPPMIPLIFYLVHRIERFLPFPHHYERLGVAFFLLSCVFSVTAFIVTFAITWGIQREKTRRPKTAWSGKTRGGRLGIGFMRFVLRIGGLPLAYFMISFAIPYFYLFAPKAKNSLEQYWKNVDPTLNFGQRQWRILLHFYRFAQILIDRAFQEGQAERVFKIQSTGLENIIQAVDAKKGLVLVTAHVGGWDLASYVLRKKNGAGDFRMVKFEADGLTYDKAVGKSETEKVHQLLHQESQYESGSLIFKIRGLLDQGIPVGLMGDRPVSYQVELVKFMGKLAIWDTTPARVAKICKTPLIATFGFKNDVDGYDFYAFPSIDVNDTFLATQTYCTQLEGLIQKYPDQWFNFFPFWSHVPSALLRETRNLGPAHLAK
jgi:predicted LPLAT superfamily acyltransferase/glycosyltransferase involved in cell wall biosynthesis